MPILLYTKPLELFKSLMILNYLFLLQNSLMIKLIFFAMSLINETNRLMLKKSVAAKLTEIFIKYKA